MSTKSKLYVFLSVFIMVIFFSVKTLVLVELINSTPMTRATEYICFLSFIPLFWLIFKDYVSKAKESLKNSNYIKSLNDNLIRQSQNTLFYEGKITEGTKTLTKEVTNSLNTDRCSIWLYDENKSSIVCQQLYVAKEDKWYQGIELFEKDFKPYFDYLKISPVVIADDAEIHPATSCFTKNYLIPLGIKSMLDVPIIYMNEIIGVICIESLDLRKWTKPEINFVQILSSLYSFAYSMKESEIISNNLKEFDRFVDNSVLVTRADAKGRITYVNKKFEKVSGWKLEEVIGKDHKVVNSGFHPKEFWVDMYKTVVKDKKIWNAIVTNTTKNGKLYHVDSFIKAEFDEDGKHIGFVSIRQDVTDIIQLNDKLNNIVSSQTAYVLRTDMEGKHTYWNQKFEDEFGWVYEGNMMHGDSLLSICESHHGAAQDAVMKCIAEPGKIIKVELDKPHRDGSKRTTLWEFVCLTDKNGRPLEVQCMGVDITDRVKAEKKIIEVLKEVERKNAYLEHAAKILRHDMHSGINTYIPRGLSSLERRLTVDDVQKLKIESPLRMIREGLKHTQKVYKGVYEFTNLVKKDSVLNKTECNVKTILSDYLSATSYGTQVILDDNLPNLDVNESLFCTAIDNLIRNGLKYNDSDNKMVKIYCETYRKQFGLRHTYLIIEDNGRGMSQEDFEHLSKPYTRKENQKESGTGLGLNICRAILQEHGFSITAEKLDQGTKLSIKIK